MRAVGVALRTLRRVIAHAEGKDMGEGGEVELQDSSQTRGQATRVQ